MNTNSGISFLDYIVENNARGVNSVVLKYGYPQPQDKEELLEAAHLMFQQNPNSLNDLLIIHPDYDIIKRSVLKKQQKKQSKNYSNNSQLSRFVTQDRPVNNNEIQPQNKIDVNKIEEYRILYFNEKNRREMFKDLITYAAVGIGIYLAFKVIKKIQ